MPTISVASIVSATSPVTTAVTIQQPSTDIAALAPGLHSLQLESSMAFSLVFATVVVGLVLARHFIARARSGPIDLLA